MLGPRFVTTARWAASPMFAFVALASLPRCGSKADTSAAATLDAGAEASPRPEPPPLPDVAPPTACLQASEPACQAAVANGQLASERKNDCLNEGARACYSQHYFSGFAAPVLADCTDGGLVLLRGRLETALFQGPGIKDADVAYETQGLQRYFAPYELQLSADGPPKDLTFRSLIVGSEATLEQALRDAHIPSNGTETDAQRAQANEIVAKIMFVNLYDFLGRFAEPASSRFNIVVIDQIVADEAIPALGLPSGQVIVGLGLSPALIDNLRADDPQLDLYRLLGISGAFTPTLFVGHRDIRRYLSQPDVVVAHEMGHALGLEHSTVKGNLMAQGLPKNCRPVLTEEQADAMVGVQALAASIAVQPTLGDLLLRSRTLTDRLLGHRESP